MSMNRTVIVVGSYSAALFFKGKQIPNPGQTVTADSFFESFGGKGSNQAITVAKQGAPVRFVCKIGTDGYAQKAIALYKELGMMSPSVLQDASSYTSIGVIIIDENGNNAISIALGANSLLTKEEIVHWAKQEEKPFLVGFQLENDVDTIVGAIKACSEMNISTLLDPAPAAPLPDWIYPHITYIKPNEHEAKILSGIAIETVADAYRAGEWFINRGVQTAIITLGGQGTALITKEIQAHFPAVRTEAVDTTGAGDVFSGSLMAAMAKGMAIEDAIAYATCAASISVTRMGVVEAIPNEEEVRALYNAIKTKES